MAGKRPEGRVEPHAVTTTPMAGRVSPSRSVMKPFDPKRAKDAPVSRKCSWFRLTHGLDEDGDGEADIEAATMAWVSLSGTRHDPERCSAAGPYAKRRGRAPPEEGLDAMVRRVRPQPTRPVPQLDPRSCAAGWICTTRGSIRRPKTPPGSQSGELPRSR